MPILKQLVAGSQTKRRSRMDLTTEMISAPLGDFRHTMHVGRSGEAFGDTSFLSSRSGEPPREVEPTFPRSPKPGLLSRTFRSSKRSQSVNRVDQRENTLAPPDGSPTFVKNAMSLPFLNDEGDGDHREGAGRALKSLSSSPMRQAPEADSKASNGAVAGARMLDLEQHEQLFGILTDLRSPGSYGGGGMKKAESVMSFHLDLGPSMLEDILDVMEKEDDDLGFEEGKSGEGRTSPPLCMHTVGDEGDEEMDEEQRDHDEKHGKEEEQEDEEDEKEEEDVKVKVKMVEAEIENHVEDREHQQPQHQQRYELDELEDIQHLDDQAPPRPPSSVDLDTHMEEPDIPEPQPKHLQNTDSCSMSSSSSNSGSAALEEKPPSQLLEVETPGVTRYSPPPPVQEGDFSSFIEDEDDEIRV